MGNITTQNDWVKDKLVANKVHHKHYSGNTHLNSNLGETLCLEYDDSQTNVLSQHSTS